MSRHNFTQKQIQQKFRQVYGDDDYSQEKFLPKLKQNVQGEKVKQGVDFAVELAFYDAFQGLPPIVMKMMEK